MSKLKGLLTVVVAAGGLAVLAPSAVASGSPLGPPAGPTTPPFTQCPAIGEDTTCQYLIDVKSTTEPPVIIEDPSQIYYDGSDDVTVAVQNETGAPLSKVHIGVLDSGDGVFSFDGDGICAESIVPRPSGCPFSTELSEAAGYTGPDTELKAEGESTDAGTVTFPTPLANDQYTYFTLEAPPYGTTLVAGEVNDTIATKLSPSPQTEPPTEEARLTFLTPTNVTDKATIVGPNAKLAEGEVEYRVYSDPGCTKEVANAGKAKVAVNEAGEAVAGASQPVGASLPTNATYYWQVKYTGSKKGIKAEENSPATSACGAEAMSFGVASVVTTLSGGGQIGASLTVAPGTPVTDTATVSAGGQSVYGTIEYKVYSNASCTTEVANGGSVITLNGIGPSSQPVTLTKPGTYYFQASFTGTKVALTGKSACGGEVVTVVSPPPPPPPPSQFTLVGTPQLNTKTGQLVVVAQFPGAGTATSTGVVEQGATLARVEPLASAAKHHGSHGCKHGYVKRGKRCVNNAPVPYGTTVLHVPAAGTYSIVLTPAPTVLKALKAGKRLNVVVSTTFQNSAGGAPVTQVQNLTAALPKSKKHKHHHR